MATVADIDEARARRRQHLTTAIATLRSEQGFRAWLTARRVFHHYSPMNVLWIVSQCPHATHVAGFGTWRSKLGYQVRKGETGIAINVPRPYRVSDQGGNEREEAEVPRVALGSATCSTAPRSTRFPARPRPLNRRGRASR